MRLIDADVLLKKADWFEYYDEDGHWDGFKHINVDDVEKAPTIDAVEVVHGQWENGNCTNCGQVDFSKPNYCPNCGAKMDGDMTQTLLRKLEDT